MCLCVDHRENILKEWWPEASTDLLLQVLIIRIVVGTSMQPKRENNEI